MGYTGCRAFLTLACLSLLSACAPPGYSESILTSIAWPRSDQALSIEQRAEVEGRLRALKYLSEPADGVISVKTRDAIRSFQRDIGAPISGFVSVPLLDALRTNSAYLTADELKAVNRGAIIEPSRSRTTTPAKLSPASTDANAAGGGSDGSGSAGGSGGASGGAWN